MRVYRGIYATIYILHPPPTVEVIRSTIIWDYSENEDTPARAIKNYASVSEDSRRDKYRTRTRAVPSFVSTQWFSRVLMVLFKIIIITATLDGSLKISVLGDLSTLIGRWLRGDDVEKVIQNRYLISSCCVVQCVSGENYNLRLFRILRFRFLPLDAFLG